MLKYDHLIEMEDSDVGRKRLPTEVKELRKMVRELENTLEISQNRNQQLSEDTTKAFKATGLYKQMDDKISWYKNLYNLEQTERQLNAGRVAKLSEEQRMKIEDADRILENKTKDTFFVGITKHWLDSKERSSTLLKCTQLEAENDMLRKQLKELIEKNEQIVSENAQLRFDMGKAGVSNNIENDSPSEFAIKIKRQGSHDVIMTGKKGRPSYQTEEFCQKVWNSYKEMNSIRKVAKLHNISTTTAFEIMKSAKEIERIESGLSEEEE